MVICFFALLVLLIAQVLSNVKDVNDGWILDGLLWHFILLTVVYAVIVGFSKDVRLVAIITSIYLVVVNLIPNLKYIFPYGSADPLLHYGSIQGMVESGQVSGVGAYESQYAAAPGLHIVVTEIAIVTGLSALNAFKLYLIILPLTIPLAIYFVTTKIEISNVLAKAMIASSSIVMPMTYIFFGTTSVYPLYVLFIYLCLLFLTCGIGSRSEVLAGIVLGIGILVSHDATSFFMMSILIFLVIMMKSNRVASLSARVSSLPFLFILTFIVMALAHFSLTSSISNFSNLLSLINEAFLKVLSGSQPVALSSYEGFNVLSLIDKIKILTVRYGKDVLSLLLVLLSPVILWRARLRVGKLHAFLRILVVPLVLTLSVFFFFLFLRPYENRGLIYVAALYPFLGGLTIYYLCDSINRRYSHVIMASVVFLMLCVSTVTTYPCQPLIPAVPGTQGKYYALDMRSVNTIYDRSIVAFVGSHDQKTTVWADQIIRDQAYALANQSFQSLFSWHYNEAPLIIITLSGTPHAIPSGRDAMANDDFLASSLINESVLYSNGFSHLLLNVTASRLP